jgi:hypothetical protein
VCPSNRLSVKILTQCPGAERSCGQETPESDWDEGGQENGSLLSGKPNRLPEEEKRRKAAVAITIRRRETFCTSVDCGCRSLAASA